MTVIIYRSSFGTMCSSLPNFGSICRKLHDLLSKETVLNGTVKDYEKMKRDQWSDTALKSVEDALQFQIFLQDFISEQSVPSHSAETVPAAWVEVSNQAQRRHAGRKPFPDDETFLETCLESKETSKRKSLAHWIKKTENQHTMKRDGQARV